MMPCSSGVGVGSGEGVAEGVGVSVGVLVGVGGIVGVGIGVGDGSGVGVGSDRVHATAIRNEKMHTKSAVREKEKCIFGRE